MRWELGNVEECNGFQVRVTGRLAGITVDVSMVTVTVTW